MSETKVLEPQTESDAPLERPLERVASPQTLSPAQTLKSAGQAIAQRLPKRTRFVVENLGTFILALLLSVFIWVAAINEQNPPREDLYPNGVPIELLNLPPSLVPFQFVERSARVRIRAPQASWERLQASGVRATADLRDATAGLHEFAVQVTFADPDITIVSQDLQRLSLRLEELREKNFRVQVTVSDSPPVGYVISTTQSIPSSVQISGAQSQVDQVVEVVAVVPLRGAKSAVEREVALIARDTQGNTVAGVKLTPANVTVKVPVEQQLGFKDVSVKVVVKGTVASGYWISNIAVDPSTITIVGSPAARLDEVGGFISTETIDVKDVKSSLFRRVNLVLPEGVSPVNAQGVYVTIDVAPIEGGQTVQRQITVQGLDRGLKATLSPETVDIILSGPLPVLQALKVDDVKVVIDLVNKAPGKYKLTPTVIKPDSLKVASIVPDSIEVVISK